LSGEGRGRGGPGDSGRASHPRWSPSVGVKLLVGGIIAAVLVAFVAVVVADVRQGGTGGAPAGVETIDVGQGGRHTEEVVDYAQSPPAGGEHNPVWQNAGFYEESVTNENAVHTLEHGAVWITYSPDLPEDQVGAIRDLAQGQDCVLASPYEGLSSPVVVSSWGKQLRLEGAEDPDLERFVRAYKQGPETPEPGAPCTGGIGAPS
jgi:hypothetical protein